MRIFAILMILLVVLLPLTERRISTLKSRLNEKIQEIRELQERRAIIKEVEELLKTAPPKLELVEPQVISQVVAPTVAYELAQNLMKSLGIKGEIVVDDPLPSLYFPEVLNIYEVPVEMGVEEYASYLELVKLITLMRESPLYIESFDFGGSEGSYRAKGRLHIRCKFLFINGG